MVVHGIIFPLSNHNFGQHEEHNKLENDEVFVDDLCLDNLPLMRKMNPCVGPLDQPKERVHNNNSVG